MAIGRGLIVVVFVFNVVFGYPPQGRLMPDGAPVPEDAVASQDSMASASEIDEEYEDADDSDMYMETEDPDEDEQNADEQEETSTLPFRPILSAQNPTRASQSPINPSQADPTSALPFQPIPASQNPGEASQSSTKSIQNQAQASQRPINLTRSNPTSTLSLQPSPDSQNPSRASENRSSNGSTPENSPSKDQAAENTKENQRQASSVDSGSLETDSQNFFPSFAELFSSHRLPFTEQQRYRPNRFLGYFQRDRSGYQPSAASNKEVHHPLLGSGNFGVIRGGTYYPEDKEADEYSADDTAYNPYYRGRANYFRNPKPQPIRGGDFFANFRDFADITAPPKSSFSHLSVVYANKNGSAAGRITEPRNIIETLRMLEEEEPRSSEETATEVPRKKLSKGKRKLLKMKQNDDEKARRSRMTVEPLLALS